MVDGAWEPAAGTVERGLGLLRGTSVRRGLEGVCSAARGTEASAAPPLGRSHDPKVPAAPPTTWQRRWC